MTVSRVPSALTGMSYPSIFRQHRGYKMEKPMTNIYALGNNGSMVDADTLKQAQERMKEKELVLCAIS